MIKRKIENLIECMNRDSEDGIQDNSKEIKKQLERIDQNSEFLNYLKTELTNVVI